MKRKFQIDGIGCGGCIYRVKRVLEAHPAIEKTEVLLNSKGVTFIKMNMKLTVNELQKQLDTIEGFTITEVK